MPVYKRVLPYIAVILAVGCRDQRLPSDPTGPVPPPSLDIGFVSTDFATANNGTGASSSSLTLPVPLTVAVGDVLLAQVGLTKDINPTDKICAPAGWTSVVKNTFQNKYVQEIFYHVVSAVPVPNIWRFKTSAGNCAVAGNANARTGKGASGGLLRFTGVDPQEPIDAFAGASGSSSGPQRAPSVNTSADGDRVVRFFLAEKQPLTFGPATTRAYNVGSSNNSSPRTVAAFQATQAAMGPTGDFDATVSTSTEWVSATVALRPDGCSGVNGPCNQETINLAVGGSVVLEEGGQVIWRIDVPPQGPGAPTITLSLQLCPEDLDIGVPVFGTCLRVGAPDGLADLNPKALVSNCSLVGDPEHPAEEEEQIVTLLRVSDDDGTVTALSHDVANCPPLPSPRIGMRGPGDTPILTRLVQVVRDAVRWLVEPRPLAAAASSLRRMRLDVGPGGRTAEFSDFQAGLAGIDEGAEDAEPTFGWTMTGFWNRSTLEGDGPIVNSAYPTFVTNAEGDASAGALPDPFEGTYVFWYGEEADGNYLGTQVEGDANNSGGTSTSANTGTLTSPAFVVPADGVLRFNTWFEIESVDAHSFDLMTISVEVVGGATTELGRLNGATDFNGAANVPFTSGGFDTAPVWFEFFAPLGATYAGKSVRLHFTFNTGDFQYNGFRGWLLDNIRVSSETPPVCEFECFKGFSAALKVGGARPLNPPQPPKSREPRSKK